MTGTVSPVLPSALELGEILQQVWTSFLDGEITAARDDGFAGDRGGRLVASVSISGEWTGHVMIVTGQDCAREIAASMFMMDASEVSIGEIADALGEIANMVGGSVKGMVGVVAALSLPQVVLDASALVNPDARRLVSVYAHWKNRPLEVSLWERSAGQRDDAATRGVS